MMFTLYGMFAENEVKQRVERFTRKKRDLMEAGMSISGKLLFGYKGVLLLLVLFVSIVVEMDITFDLE